MKRKSLFEMWRNPAPAQEAQRIRNAELKHFMESITPLVDRPLLPEQLAVMKEPSK